MTPLRELTQILETLKQPEYIHILINPLPLYGMLIGVLLLAGGLLFKDKGVQVAALFVIMGIGLATWPVVEFGQDGYDRVLAMSNQEAQSWLKLHRNRAENLQYLFYGTSTLALWTLLAIRKGKSRARLLAIYTIASSLACVAAGGWIGHAGGQIRHSEFRAGPPP